MLLTGHAEWAMALRENGCKEIKLLAGNYTRTFGLEDSSNQYTAAMAQRCEFSTVDGEKKTTWCKKREWVLYRLKQWLSPSTCYR